MYAKNERVSVIITATVLLGLMVFCGLSMLFDQREVMVQTGRMSVYNRETRNFREVEINGYLPLPGDGGSTAVWKTETPNRISQGSFFTVLGMINLVTALRVLRDRRPAAITPATPPTPDPARSAVPATPPPR